MSFVVSGLVPQMSHNFDCSAGNGMAFCIPTRAKILTRGIVTVSVNSMVCICNLLTLVVVEVEGGRWKVEGTHYQERRTDVVVVKWINESTWKKENIY